MFVNNCKYAQLNFIQHLLDELITLYLSYLFFPIIIINVSFVHFGISSTLPIVLKIKYIYLFVSILILYFYLILGKCLLYIRPVNRNILNYFGMQYPIPIQTLSFW